MLTVQFLFHSAANCKHTKRHANLPVLTAQKYMMSQCKSTVNAQYDRPILLLNCEIPLHLSNFSATVSTKICLWLSSTMKLGPDDIPGLKINILKKKKTSKCIRKALKTSWEYVYLVLGEVTVLPIRGEKT